jgi:hypothetical protein
MNHVVWPHEGTWCECWPTSNGNERSSTGPAHESAATEGGQYSNASFDQALAQPPGSPAPDDSAAPAFDYDAWLTLVQAGEEAAQNAADPRVAAEINDLVDRFDTGRLAEQEYEARLAQLAGPPAAGT